MKYRAKCTKIVSLVETIYNTNNHKLVKDAKDIYIEVNFEDEAELIEKLNKHEAEKIAIINELEELRDQ